MLKKIVLGFLLTLAVLIAAAFYILPEFFDKEAAREQVVSYF